MAMMADQLAVRPGQRVLEIGAGTGYNAALLAHLAGPDGEVISVDIDAELVEVAQQNLARAGVSRVTVVCGDGASGFAARGPYDRIIATVGVWDLAPAWLDQLAPDGRLVVPLDLGGVQRSIAFERSGDHWTSRSVVSCGFMRLRGAFAGPEQAVVLDRDPALVIMVPGRRPIDSDAVLAALDQPAVVRTLPVAASASEIIGDIGLWLAIHEPRWCVLSESAAGTRLPGAPVRVHDQRVTAGMQDGDSVAALARPVDRPNTQELAVLGYGPDGERLAGELAAQVDDWARAGRPGNDGLRIDAYPMSTMDQLVDDPATHDRMIIEKRHTRLVMSWLHGLPH